METTGKGPCGYECGCVSTLTDTLTGIMNSLDAQGCHFVTTATLLGEKLSFYRKGNGDIDSKSVGQMVSRGCGSDPVCLESLGFAALEQMKQHCL